MQDAINWITQDGPDWALWAACAVALFAGLRLLRSFASALLETEASGVQRARTIAAGLVAKTWSPFLLAISFTLTAPFLREVPDAGAAPADDWLFKLAMVATVIQIMLWIRVLAHAFIEDLVLRDAADPRTAQSMQSLLRLLANVALAGIALVMILNNLGYDASALLAGLGIGGIAIGLAAQTIFQDLFASVSIMLDRPFVKGDFVSFNGFSGTIDRIGLKTTRLKSLSGEQLVVSNGNLLSNEIQNYKVMADRRATFTLGVVYQTPHAVLADIPAKIEAIIARRSTSRFDRCHLSAFGDSAIEFTTVYYILSPDYADFMDEQQAIYLAIHSLFEELGVEFAYPTQTLFVTKTG